MFILKDGDKQFVSWTWLKMGHVFIFSFLLQYVKTQNEYGTELTALPWRSLLLYFLIESRVEGESIFLLKSYEGV